MAHTFLNEQLTYADGLTMRLVYNALEQDDTQSYFTIRSYPFVQNLPKKHGKVLNRWVIVW